MKKIPILLVALGIGITLFIAALRKESSHSVQLDILKAQYAKKHVPSVDHAKLPALQRKFSSPQQVTEACVSCHTESHKEVMQSSHWNWERAEYIPGRGVRYIGKKNIVNNFCIGVSPNLEECDACHIGYGWVDAAFDFSDWKNIDCLACHDNSNTYVKGLKGYPDPSVNLTTVAQHVGRPLRTNCGTCHFFGGGGNNVKHGDLEKALFDTNRDVDVHMASDGEDMQCVACHTAENHKMLGKLYSVSSMNRNRSSCEQCHTSTPHNEGVLNEHTSKVSCQACHIPEYAKVNSTKLYWDWSAAGKLKDGKPYAAKDSLGNDIYLSIKGSFVWGRNVKPEYIWFDGTAGHYLLGDTVSVDRPIQINSLYGSYANPDAKIVPVRIQRSVQIYDPVNKMLIEPKLFAEEKGEGAFWKDFDWNRAAEEGMKTVHLPYSGEYKFVRTEMTWPVNHMVSPKEKAVTCAECHTRNNSRLAGLKDFYMPGRNYSATVDTLGVGVILVALFGIVIHTSARVFVRRSPTKEKA
jgi:octaheme c-type cytochrome (tetrathionate reductase family)